MAPAAPDARAAACRRRPGGRALADLAALRRRGLHHQPGQAGAPRGGDARRAAPAPGPANAGAEARDGRRCGAGGRGEGGVGGGARLVLAQDVLLLTMPWRRALRRAVPWAVAVAAYLAAYWALVRFQAGWFYGSEPSGLAAKAVATIGAFLHVLPPVPWEFGALLAERPLGAALAVALTLALAAFTVVRHERRALFCLLASAMTALPTLPGAGQAGRYMLLPWLFFLAACALALREAGRVLRMTRLLDATLVTLGTTLLAGDAVRVRGDLADWSRFAALARALETEAAPLLSHARTGGTLVVLRGDDGGPLRRLLESPRGQLKLYFPRPDDPYGAASLSALLSWQTYREGFVLERVTTLPPGGLRRPSSTRRGSSSREVPAGPVLGGGSRPAVMLVPRPWETFDPAAFP